MAAGAGGGYTGAMPLNDATFRARLTDTGQNAQLALSSIRGNAYQRFSIGVDTLGYNIRTALVNAGWNGTSKGSVDLIVGGITVYTNTTGGYAMDTGGPWPGPSTVYIYNSGYILGMGGAGGDGATGTRAAPGPFGGTNGSGGGPGLLVQRATYISNGGYICGGGGGGGAGNAGDAGPVPGFPTAYASTRGGGGGGGGAGGYTASAGGAGGPAAPTNYPSPGAPGGNGGWNSAGAGGQGGKLYFGAPTARSNGNTGGGWGAGAGAGGSPTASPTLIGFAGGGAGAAIQNWSLVSGGGGLIYGPLPG